jgi:periplasmic divalent cation tolerance protein
MAEETLIVLTTWPDVESARKAARTLVEEQLAACGNILPGVESIYRWQGAVETSTEVLVLFKTTLVRYAQLETRIKALHTYEVPEIIALPVADGLPAYLHWVEASCGGEGERSTSNVQRSTSK